MAATAKRKPALATAIAERRRVVSQLRLAGATQMEISRQVHASQSVISEDLKVVHGEWLAERVENTDLLVARELLKLNETEIEVITLWRDEKERAKKFHPIIDMQTKAITGYEGRPPNTAFLDRIITIRESRRRLLGIDGPTKVEHTMRDLRERAEQASVRTGVPVEEIMEDALALADGVN